MPDKDVIRLTNRTARALRESARRRRLLFRIAAVVLTIVLAAVSVLLGLRWLFAVPAGVLTAVLPPCSVCAFTLSDHAGA